MKKKCVKSISALSRVLHSDKNFLLKNFVYEREESNISKYGCAPLQKFFTENFRPVRDSLVSTDKDIKMRTKKNIVFHGEKNKNEYCVNQPLISTTKGLNNIRGGPVSVFIPPENFFL